MNHNQETFRLSAKRIETFAGKVLIEGTIETKTGLHIGGEESAIEVGGIGNVILRNRLTRKPYIPGSALRGKMRALLERRLGKEQNWSLRRDEEDGTHLVRIHVCIDTDDQNNPPTFFHDPEFAQSGKFCPVCWIFGVPAEARRGNVATRLYVHDCHLLTDTDNVTESKWEAAIDRITSTAVPRQLERVLEKNRFSLSLEYEIYQQAGEIIEDDIERLFDVFTLLVELSDDYIGGMGSRGSGYVHFDNIKVYWQPRTWYEQEEPPELVPINGEHTTPSEIAANFNTDIKPKLGVSS